MAVALEVIQKPRADVVAFHGNDSSGLSFKTCRICSAVKPRPCRKRAWRAQSARVAGGRAPYFLRRTRRSTSNHSVAAKSTMRAIAPVDRPRAASSRRTRAGPYPRACRDRTRTSANRASETRPSRASRDTALEATMRENFLRSSLARSSCWLYSRRANQESAARRAAETSSEESPCPFFRLRPPGPRLPRRGRPPPAEGG